jgi:hypothetical protein
MLIENFGICMYGLCIGEQPRDDGLKGILEGKLEYLELQEFWALVEVGLSLENLQNLDQESWIDLALGYGKAQSQVFGKVKSMLPWSLRSAFFESSERLITFLETNQELFSTRLQELEGWAEFSLVIKLQKIEEAFNQEQLKGRAYFDLRKQEFERQQQVKLESEAIVELVQADPERVRWEELKPGEQGRVNVLLKVQEVDQIKERLRAWQSLNQGWSIELGEALPPYSFV